ncbi:MAG: ribonuclease J [Firmicutes bacterium]|nr:ribonuclease J [Bacillota bacterium]
MAEENKQTPAQTEEVKEKKKSSFWQRRRKKAAEAEAAAATAAVEVAEEIAPAKPARAKGKKKAAEAAAAETTAKKPAKKAAKTEKKPADKKAEKKTKEKPAKGKQKTVEPTPPPVDLLEKPAEKAAKAPKAKGGKKSGHEGPKLRVISLGGLGEVGKNMTVLEYGDDIIIIDCGVMFPGEDLPGVDLVIPDYSYLSEKKDNIRGFFLTHGHEDHIGGMPYALRDLKAPVYGTALTLGLLKAKLAEHRVPMDAHVVKPRDVVDAGVFRVEFIRVTHSIPDSVGLAIHTPVGTVLVISDFKMDMSPIDGELTDFGRISALGEKGVLLLLADSTNAERDGFTPSEKTVGYTFDKLFAKAAGRIIVTTFASNVHRLQQAIWSAYNSGRKVAIVGRGMQTVSSIAMELGYLKMPPGTQIDIDDINDYPDSRILILTTGSQGEPLSALTRMAAGEHRQVKIMPGDTVIISATPIPGNERLVGRTIDNLYRQGATVIYERSAGIHVSGHASRDELRVLLNMAKPKYFMPMHGEYRMLYKHVMLAQELGMSAENTFVMEKGQVLEISRKHAAVSGSVPAGQVLIDGLGVGDIGASVLRDRRQLAEGGMIIVNAVFTRGGLQPMLLVGPEITSRGFIFEREYEHIIDEIKEKVAEVLTPNQLSDCHVNDLRQQVRVCVERYITKRTGRRPIVVPVINEI